MPADDSIREWRQVVSQEGERSDAKDPPLLATLYTACSSFYSNILSALCAKKSLQPAVLTSLQRSHDYLKLWANGYGVDEELLDSLLCKSQRARRGTFRHLASICRTLTNRLLPLTEEDQRPQLYLEAGEVGGALERFRFFIEQDTKDDDSDASSETSSDDDLDAFEIAEDLKTDAQCLLDQGYRFNEQAVGHGSTSHAPVNTSVASVDSDPLRVIFIDRIRGRYPSCKGELVELLGKAQHERFIRCKETRIRNNQSRLNMPSSDETAARKAASISVPDSGLGSSIPTASGYAETVVSYAGGEGGSVHVPSLPEGANRGIPFECVACEKMIVMTNRSRWNLGTSTFLTKAQWEHHIVSEHGDLTPWKSDKCPICLDDAPGGTLNTLKHLADHLEQIALTGLPTAADSAESADSAVGFDDKSSHQSSASRVPLSVLHEMQELEQIPSESKANGDQEASSEESLEADTTVHQEAEAQVHWVDRNSFPGFPSEHAVPMPMISAAAADSASRTSSENLVRYTLVTEVQIPANASSSFSKRHTNQVLSLMSLKRVEALGTHMEVGINAVLIAALIILA
ncbi:hypothetical protein PGQ11_009242 [Apiospora arundinis]|uniref:Uncharacterized protein n=1 Tax=Apiospora arundinis TaxID=335852 RepID=A0ABR2II56_9PEZI